MVRAMLDVLLANPIYTIACAIAIITTLSAALSFLSGLKAGARDAVSFHLARRLPKHERAHNPVVTVDREGLVHKEAPEQADSPDVSINSFAYDPTTQRIVMTVEDTLGEEDGVG